MLIHTTGRPVRSEICCDMMAFFSMARGWLVWMMPTPSSPSTSHRAKISDSGATTLGTGLPR